MNELSESDFADQVAKFTYEKFSKLTKKGKTQEKKEWTLLASILMSNSEKTSDKSISAFKIVALATGTKCLGHLSLSQNGDVVNDSHAEILVRRTFKRFLLDTMSSILSGKESEFMTFEPSKGFLLKPGVQFHLFISHTPCGDASIFPKEDSRKRTLEVTNELQSKKIKFDDKSSSNQDGETCNKNQPLTENKTDYKAMENSTPDIFRTGAKCVANGPQDPKGPGMSYHITGALRTKPGRGDPTESMSCSDKIALWNVCGIQGALIACLLQEPIYLTSIIIGKCPFNQEALQRAIVTRTQGVVGLLPNGFKHTSPRIFQSQFSFPFSKGTLELVGQQVMPSPLAMIWNLTMNDSTEVCVNGRKQGATKKNAHKPCSWSTVCKHNIFKQYLSILRSMPKDSIDGSIKSFKKSYWYYKQKAKDYQIAKCEVFKLFTGWKKKPIIFQKFKCVT